MIKHIIFDCFGTLIDTGTGSIDAVRKILSNVDSDIDVERFYSMWKKRKKEMMHGTDFVNEKTLFEMSLAEVFADYGIIADAGVEVKPMIESLFGDRRVFPDVKETLKILDDKRIEYAIGSTTDTDSLLYYLALNDLQFTKVFTSEDMQVYKPDRLFYEKILEQSNWKPAECLFVGDSYVDDVCGPQKVGMKTALIDRKVY